MRAIDKLIDRPDESIQRGVSLRKFAVAALCVLTYAPDRESDSLFMRFRQEFDEHFRSADKLEEALEREFLEHLYAERGERKEIESMIPAMRPILVHGLPGVGKTVVLKKSKAALGSTTFKFIYFDFKALVETIEAIPARRFGERFRGVLYSKIYDEYVATSESLLREWPIFKIQTDIAYAGFREWVLDSVQRPLPITSDWEKALNQDLIRQKFESLGVRAELNTLLLFLKKQFGLVLCFDNVDRFPIKTQRDILSQSIDISNGAQIPVIVAIRDPNLRRLLNEESLHDIVLTDYLERIKAGGEKDVPINDMPNPSIEILLRNRIGFLQNHEAFGTLSEFFEEGVKQSGLDFDQYLKRFWGIFGVLTETFVEKDLYRYCNFNLREILIHYFQLISKILLNPEEEYSASKLITDTDLARITKLRNYFYKWLMCANKTIPPLEGSLLNIFRSPPLNLCSVDLRILEFLYNWEKKHSNDRLKFDVLASEFRRFGVNAQVLGEHLSRLTTNQGRHELGFVWLDKHGESQIVSDTIIELMPAGDYFLKIVSTSREYAFWNALMVDLDQDLVGRRFGLSETYRDEFKFEIIYRFAERVLLPTLIKEKEYFDNNLLTPKEWNGTNWEYFRKYFSVDGYLYPYRLLNSVANTIPFSSMRPDRQKDYREKYSKLLAKFEEYDYL